MHSVCNTSELNDRQRIDFLWTILTIRACHCIAVSQPEQFAAKEKTGVEIADLQTTAFLQNPESLTLSWNPTHLRHVFESAQPQTVDVTLFAYRENPNAIIETGESKVSKPAQILPKSHCS